MKMSEGHSWTITDTTVSFDLNNSQVNFNGLPTLAVDDIIHGPGLVPAQDPLVDPWTASMVSQAVYCYTVPVLVVFGTVGNVLSLVVLCAETKKDTTNVSLVFLAITDTGYILSTFIRTSACIIGHLDSVLARNFQTLMFGQMIVINICFARITGLITAVISTERCLAVLMPLKVRGLVSRQRMMNCLLVIYASTFLLIGPVFFMGESRWVTKPNTSATYVRYSYTQWYMDNRLFADNYRDIFLNATLRFIPTTVVCVNTAAIILRLRKASKWRAETSTTSSSQSQVSKEMKLTIMLVTLCAIFIFCTIPGLIFQVLTYTTVEFTVFGQYKNTYKLATAVSLLTQYINSSINFVIYIALNERFAKTFRDVFGCHHRGKG